MMTLWGKELNDRGEDEKMTLRGKMDSGTFTQVATFELQMGIELKPVLLQTKMYIKPLLKLLKKTFKRNYKMIVSLKMKQLMTKMV